MTKVVSTEFVITKYIITKFVNPKFVITEFVITKFFITKFVITEFHCKSKLEKAYTVEILLKVITDNVIICLMILVLQSYDSLNDISFTKSKLLCKKTVEPMLCIIHIILTVWRG
jgi:hypothetical protein